MGLRAEHACGETCGPSRTRLLILRVCITDIAACRLGKDGLLPLLPPLLVHEQAHGLQAVVLAAAAAHALKAGLTSAVLYKFKIALSSPPAHC